MNYFIYWTDQVTPFAEKIQPALSATTMLAVIAFFAVLLIRSKSNYNPVTDTDWSKVPMSIVMLTLTFDHTFIPDQRNTLSWITVIIFVLISLLWLRTHYRKTAIEEKETEQPSSN